jgi:uncharacterized protein YndB with AHSA1/START domain
MRASGEAALPPTRQHNGPVIASICPAAVVAAPPAIIWGLLASPEALERWTDARLVSAEPPGPVQPGQRMRFTTGFWGRTLAVTMDVREVEPEARRLRLLVDLPFGLVNDETITLSETAGGGTLVRFG